MRVLEATQRFAPAIGGVEDHVRRLSDHLVGAGVEVEVVTTDLDRDRPFRRLSSVAPGAAYPVRRHRAYEIARVRHGLGIVAPSALLDIAAARVDVVHAHAFGYAPTWAAALRRRLDRTPFVITTHADEGTRSSGSRLYARGMARATVRVADRVIALTEGERALLVRLGVAAERIEVIPNGIDLTEFEPPAAPLYERDPVRPVILFVGRLYPEQKGLLPLVEAVARLPPTVTPRLRLVGEDWGGAGPVQELARQRGLSGRVDVVGPVDRAQLLREYRSADLFVLPSLFEPFGIVLLEAMDSGLPIIASRTGGIPDIVQDGRAGTLSTPGDPASLADGIARLLADEGERRRLIDAGRQRVSEYAWANLTPRFLRLFGEMTRR